MRLRPVLILFAAASVLLAQHLPNAGFDGRVTVSVSDEPRTGTTVRFRNNYSAPITAAVVFVGTFNGAGRPNTVYPRFYDSVILLTENPILPEKELVMKLGFPPGELVPGVVIFEDGTWSGHGEYVERILQRRRAARDALIELLSLGDGFTLNHTDLNTAVAQATKFVEDRQGAATSLDDRAAIVEAVGGFPGTLKINYRPGKPVFWIRDTYADLKRKLDESKPPL